MSIFKKIVTAIRGGVREVGESIIDSNSIRILEQEIKDAESHISQAKHDLTGVLAKQMQSARKVQELKNAISEHENFATQALNKGDEALALEIAEKVASIEEEWQINQTAHASYQSHADRLKALVKKSERQVADYQRQVAMVKTTESVQKATAAISNNFATSQSKLVGAKESLDRIRRRQQDFDDRLKAGESLQEDLSDKSLKDKMQAAGIGGNTQSSGHSVLDRLRAKQQA